ncbi:hypothetical protein Misp02_10740 [Microtetraspora sp. NBRC 16547]|nr:hypothetical protein Misp02_10740 [Microtetraspora sp. NBRC 16547]
MCLIYHSRSTNSPKAELAARRTVVTPPAGASAPGWSPQARARVRSWLRLELLRPVLQDALGNVPPPVEDVARTFAEALIRAAAP